MKNKECSIVGVIFLSWSALGGIFFEYNWGLIAGLAVMGIGVLSISFLEKQF